MGRCAVSVLLPQIAKEQALSTVIPSNSCRCPLWLDPHTRRRCPGDPPTDGYSSVMSHAYTFPPSGSARAIASDVYPACKGTLMTCSSSHCSGQRHGRWLGCRSLQGDCHSQTGGLPVKTPTSTTFLALVRRTSICRSGDAVRWGAHALTRMLHGFLRAKGLGVISQSMSWHQHTRLIITDARSSHLVQSLQLFCSGHVRPEAVLHQVVVEAWCGSEQVAILAAS